MASKSDGKVGPGITFSSMKQPPLIKQLKGILSEYPDGGQILKEIIQNAEDAEASEVKIFFDRRRINNKVCDTSQDYDRFFKGPALCIYNDGVFSEKDWDGIRMIYSSVKEDDPLTVGRFGLGFKSVFHITDFPCVISGSKMLLIDPQRPANEVNAMIDLNRIDNVEDEGLNANAFWSAFGGTFGFSRECAEAGYFSGSIFRFPLREVASEISDTLYDEAKVMDLFDGFQSEASSVLLFLKNLCRISVSVFDGGDLMNEIAVAEIEDSSGRLKQKRSKFKEKIQILSSDYKGEDIYVDLHVTIRTTVNNVCETAQWQVINYFIGNSASPQFKKLIQDKSLGYSPYVGVAAPLSPSISPLEGHVFCFLPLPREGSRLTGLPVHVNGFFALSQNRHHLKWETDEQKGKKIDDKSILWNKCLINEALPKAYGRLVQDIVEVSNKLGNTDESVEVVYNSLPLGSNVQSKWKAFEAELYKKIKKLKIMYSESKGKWVTVSDACFASFDKLPDDYTSTSASVIQCLNLLGKNHVALPLNAFNNLRKHFKSVRDLCPESLAQLLRQNAAYKNLSNLDKVNLLTYLFSDEKCYEKVEGLELLPLESGRWTKFKTQQDPIFICLEEETYILQGLEDKIVKTTTSFGNPLSSHIENLSVKGLFQVKKMELPILVQLLETTIKDQLGTSLCITRQTKLSFQWLQAVWSFIIERNCIQEFRNVHIVPVLTNGTWEEPEALGLETLNDTLLIKSSMKNELPERVCSCFENLGIRVLSSLPDWIPKEKVKSHFYWPTQKSVVALLSKLGSDSRAEEKVDIFNTTCKLQDKSAFAACIAKCAHIMTKKATEFVRCLKLFFAISSVRDKGILSSVSETSCYIKEKEFPEGVQFPFSCLDADSSSEALLMHLGARKIDLQELVLSALKGFQNKGFQNSNEVLKFMDFFINKFHLFQSNQDIIDSASNVPFLKAGSNRHKAKDLFDPSDNLLKDLLMSDALLPETKKPLNAEKIRILKFLGLKTSEDITADTIFQVAKSLDCWPEENKSNAECLRKAEALMKLLHSKHFLLDEKCYNGVTLANCLRTLSCIPVERNRVAPYPSCVGWFSQNVTLCKPINAKEKAFGCLVGAIVPIVSSCSDRLNAEFEWTKQPSISDVISQLKVVKDSYSVQYRPDIMPLIKAIYAHLSKRHREVWKQSEAFSDDRLIWNGEDFVPAKKVIVLKQPYDLELQPYFSFLPAEFTNMQDLFAAFGCPLKQDNYILVETLKLIKEYHKTVRDVQTVTRDRKSVCNILEKIAEKVSIAQLPIEDFDILMMVHDDLHSNSICLFPISECVYDDDPAFFFEKDENVHLVHEMVSKNIVDALGIKSVTRKALLDAEELGVEEWGQQEPLTTRINTLLREGYTDGLSVPKELIQNADDAGASIVKFLYDERENTEFRRRVFSQEMKAFQGPALWIFNNAEFSADDLKNITKLNAATKQTDMEKIGKFGLGFCSVYNLTDVPSFLSGSSLVFFDPHEKNLHHKKTGLKYQLPNKTLVCRHIDQFKPYAGIFGCNIDDEEFKRYDGTLFRLPLRTEKQARESLVCSVPYTKEEMSSLLRMFIETAGNCLLFTQNIKQIELYHLSGVARDVSEKKMIFRIHRECVRLNKGIQLPVDKSVLSRIPNLLDKHIDFLEIHKSVIRQEHTDHLKEIIGDIDDNVKNVETVWLTSWAKGNKKSLKMYKQLASEGAVPIAAVSVPCAESNVLKILDLQKVPCGFYSEGHIFCFLPLPLKTRLQIQVNGCFSVTSDRRHLVSLTEDDKNCLGKKWNDVLMEDALVRAHCQLIKMFAALHRNAKDDYTYYELWPRDCAALLLPFKKSFYRTIIENDIEVFCGNENLLAFSDVVFLDPKIRETVLGALAYEFLSYFPPRQGKTLFEMPEYIFENIIENNREKEKSIRSALISEKELFLTFLRTLQTDFWDSRIKDRNMLIIAALKCQCSDVSEKMRAVSCIPTEPDNALFQASGLIHPCSPIASLFCEKDEIFPLNSKDFRKVSILKKLVELGMNETFIPKGRLLERCTSVSTLAEKCDACSQERCDNLLRYISQDNVLGELVKDKHIFRQMSDLYILPVLSKPTDWRFSWKAESDSSQVKSYSGERRCEKHQGVMKKFLLGKPRQLFRTNMMDYVGIVGLIVDEYHALSFKETTKYASKVFSLLGVKCLEETSVEVFVKQLELLSKEYKFKDSQYENVSRIHEKVFLYLEKKLKSSEMIEGETNALDSLCCHPSVLIGDELVKAQSVAFNVKEECRPKLYRLPEKDKRNKKAVYSYLGVKDYFDVEDIIAAMKTLKKKEREENIIESVKCLLINLDEAMQQSGKSYEELAEFHDNIIAPDIDCKLWPTYQLVVENKDFLATSSMKILHQSVAPLLAHNLGVKGKRLCCYKEIKVGLPFGQREELVTRIKGLLKAYPCDSSIMKEMLQNADDAGATEIHFVKDYRTHSKAKLFQSSCESLQDPALCVYNNSFFTEKDIEGIHNLGKGSKCDDPTKTGQYGVGFNAVYHLTDTPSFVTIGPDGENESLMFILDPLCTHVPLATAIEPGMMCRLQDLESNFSDHITGFSLGELVDSNVGTVFRFPLRSASSLISSEEISTTKMDDILFSFQTDMFECVLFLKNIRCIRVSNISSGRLEEEYTVKVELSEEAESVRKSFNETVNDITKQNMNNKANNLELNPCEAIYRLTVSDNKQCSKQWLIVQRFGVNEYVCQLDDIKEYLNSGDIGLLPLGGIALPISDRLGKAISETNAQGGKNGIENTAQTTQEKNISKSETVSMQAKIFKGKLFCFLPLPVVTGLPVHVNGHFALDHEARRDLWKDGYRHIWNTFVVNGVVIPAWISGLLHLQTLITPVIRSAKTWRYVNLTMQEFHSHFPNQDCTSDFWNHSADSFYKYLVNESVPLFSFVRDTECENIEHKSLSRRFDASWTVVTPTPNGIFYGVFNTVSDEMRECSSITQKHTLIITKLLKAFGMKLLETPNKIRLSMQKAGIEGILTSAPSQVIFFMKSCVEGSESKCAVGPLGSNICNTKYDSSSSLVVFLKYIMLDRDLYKKLEGLPVLLTADGKLGLCSLNEPVFVSEYSSLLPRDARLFVHEDIRQYFQSPTFLESNVFKLFRFDDFVRLLPNSVNVENYRRGLPIEIDEDEKEDFKEITQHWLATFYDFLFEKSCRSSKADSEHSSGFGVLHQAINEIDIDLLTENIGKLENWSFLPCKRNHNLFLIPFAETRHVLFLSFSDTLDGIGKSIEKYHLPSLYVKAFAKCNRKAEVRKAMENIVASVNRPYDLLRCLVYHRHTLEITSISENDSTEILGFFGRNLKVLESCERKCTLVGFLRQLPLYLTQQGTFTNIADTEDVLVLPKGMPNGGIQAWANTCKITLLQEKESLGAIYQFLGLQKADVQFVYGQKILPNFFAIPDQHWMDHIEFLRDKLGHIPCLNSEQLKIVNELKKIAFINVSGVTKRPNELFDPSNKVFECMVDSCNSLPCELLTQEWKPFLMKLGLICDVTDEMMLQFARKIEADSSIIQPERIYKKSKVLLERFCLDFGRSWQTLTISQIRTIKFITPFVTDKDKTDICKQYDESGALICFEGATSSNHSSLCWSSSHLLEKQLCQKLDTDVRKRLGIHEDPPLDKVVIHFENVCRSFKHMRSSFKTTDCFVKNQMSCFYEFFSNYKTLNKAVITRIQRNPFLHLPDEMDIVSASEVVIDLPQTQEIKPYLYRAPTYYGKYFDLFRSFGCKSDAMFCHYASVLNKMKTTCRNNEMSVPERDIVKRAFIGLMSLKVESDESTEAVEAVCLPTRNMTLVDSREVIVSNEILFEVRLKGLVELSLCAEMPFHNIRDELVQQCFLKWPNHLKPAFLTDVVKEAVCLEGNSAQGNRGSLKAFTIERFLHSNELTTALCRLIKHQTSYGNSQVIFDSERTENEIRDNLRNIDVIELPALRTVLKYRGNIVPGSEREIDYHIRESNGNSSISFFFNGNRHMDRLHIPSILHGMIRLLKLCANGLNEYSIIHVTLLIQELQSPHQLHLVLDRLRIKSYGSAQELQTDYFPKPGTHVEPQFIPFLVQGISPFQKHEYEHIAMELDDSSLETDNDSGQGPVFIYVKILEEVNSCADETGDLSRIYRVETGNKNIPHEKVEIYRLYRFVRRETNLCIEIELYSREQANNQIPVDEQCRKVREEIIQAWRLPEQDRKRVIRRILLQWHPDKNRGNEEYCTKVFQYIQIILSRLENGEIPVDDVNEEMSRGRSQFSQSSSAFYENVFRRARSYARAYYDNFEAYNRSERTGSYAHSSASRNKRPDFGEAQRWFQQSKHDFLAATEMFPTANIAPAFNWVCYICHQACEKAFKSAHYSIDANNVPGGIFLPALALTPEMREQANLLETRLGQNGRLTYPDSSSRPRIPSNMYDKDDAEFSLTVTRRILELVEAHL